MGNLVALDAFRETLGRRETSREAMERPDIRGGEIWGRDYTTPEAMVYGLLKVRDIVAFHMGELSPTFDQLCMNALDGAYRARDLEPHEVQAVMIPLKEWILEIMNEGSKRDLSWALVLVDLIEKSPFVDVR